jgi:hypothetical protein
MAQETKMVKKTKKNEDEETKEKNHPQVQKKTRKRWQKMGLEMEVGH